MSHKANFSKETLSNSLSNLEDRYVPRTYAAWDFTQAGLTMDNAFHDIDLSGIVPENAKAIVMHVKVSDNTPGANFLMRDKTNSYHAIAAYAQVSNLYIEVYGILNYVNGNNFEYRCTEALTYCRFSVAGWFI